ncbi:MAG: carbonic anhydrase [Clostridia bacterium]|nr:carbonic anhydrase [Clostridia bacterium]
MDYKKLIKSRSARIKIMQLLSFIPDAWMLRIQYRIKTGRKLNLRSPQRFSEKLQWYKLHYRDPAMPRCVDKYGVRQYIAQAGLGNTLTTCYGVYDAVEDVDFDALPDAFVLKDTLGSGGNSVIIVEEKDKADLDAIRAQLQSWLNSSTRLKNPGREWVYDSQKHRIIAEEYLRDSEGLTDYKFFCFGGKIACVYVIANRALGDHGELAIMDADFVRLPYQSSTQHVMKEDPVIPVNYSNMKHMAEMLSSPFPHVRVDMYSIGSRIVFGELTFFGASGYMSYEPDSFDYILGEQFDLPGMKKNIE